MQEPECIGETQTLDAEIAASINPMDQARARIYRLLADFLSEPPDSAKLDLAAGLVGDDSVFGAAISGFAKQAESFDAAAADTEFHDLFIGVTRGEVLPYGSYYLTGFLNEKPLAILRREMTHLGIERARNLKEPEDHISSLLEIMAGLIEGTYGAPLSLPAQKAFFDQHVNSWAPYFFADLEKAGHAVLYASLGVIGRHFFSSDVIHFCRMR